MTGTGKVVLSPEQQDFIERAREGRNILVNACIGSGKTTAIQRLCEELPAKTGCKEQDSQPERSSEQLPRLCLYGLAAGGEAGRGF